LILPPLIRCKLTLYEAYDLTVFDRLALRVGAALPTASPT
jgi:hypothetical protein